MKFPRVMTTTRCLLMLFLLFIAAFFFSDTAYQNSVRTLEDARVIWEKEMEQCCDVSIVLSRLKVKVFIQTSCSKLGGIFSCVSWLVCFCHFCLSIPLFALCWHFGGLGGGGGTLLDM